MWKVIFPKGLYSEMMEFLNLDSNKENGCFLISKHYRASKNLNVILINDIIKGDDSSWSYRHEDGISPSSVYINDAVNKADSKDSGLVFVHTHPGKYHPPSFSYIDNITNKKLFKNVSPILAGKPLVSLVVNKSGMSGCIYSSGKFLNVDKAIYIGSTMSGNLVNIITNQTNNVVPNFDRQIKAIGIDNQSRIRALKIAVVGVGGTGSSVATQLARMGVGELLLIDNDNLEDSNLSRVYGSSEKDLGKSKVAVVKNHLKKFSNANITSIQGDVTDEKVNCKLLSADIIFGCTDNLTSRSVLNDISLSYYIPYIDIGCRIALDKMGNIEQIVAKVQVVTPDNACLWCTEVLDGNLILQESYTDDEKLKLQGEGYYESVDKQPSIISVTNLAGTLGINKMLGLMGLFGESVYSGIRVELKEEIIIKTNPNVKIGCVCNSKRRTTLSSH